MKTITPDRIASWIAFVDQAIAENKFFGFGATADRHGAPCCVLGHLCALEGLPYSNTDDAMAALLGVKDTMGIDDPDAELLRTLYRTNDDVNGSPVAIRDVLVAALA